LGSELFLVFFPFYRFSHPFYPGESMKKNLTFRRTVLARSVLAACGASALAFMAAQPVLAQTAPTSLNRVEITGSSIKRIAAEGALPVAVITAEEIRATGVTSAVDLVRKLTTVQGSTGESASVGGGSFGFSGVSIHNIGETRTLVLLNGKRLAQFGGQSLTGFAAGFDLNSIPLSAIARVELLTDGASALYGADAIAGVVNFITKQNSTDGDVTIGFSRPASGAEEKRISATKGFGTLETNGFNVMLSFGHDERTQLFATDRNFGATGKATFEFNGKQYRKQQFSASPIPANATDDNGQLINPFQKKTGSCAPKSFRVIEPYNDGSGLVDDYCGFDFVLRELAIMSCTPMSFSHEHSRYPELHRFRVEFRYPLARRCTTNISYHWALPAIPPPSTVCLT
jgi:iron complex outermembrane recepter protein